MSIKESEEILDLLAKFSSFSKLIRVTAYFLRFITKLCLKLKERAANSTRFVNTKLRLLELPFLVVSESFTDTLLSQKELAKTLASCGYFFYKPVTFEARFRSYAREKNCLRKALL